MKLEETNTVFLTISEDETLITVVDENNTQSWTLPLGSVLLSERYFKRNILTEEEIENLITDIEETLTPLSKDILFRNKKLVVKNISKELFSTTDVFQYISNNDIEQVFLANTGRLLGRMSYMDIKPLSNDLIVALTILREFAHHLYFDGAYIQNEL